MKKGIFFGAGLLALLLFVLAGSSSYLISSPAEIQDKIPVDEFTSIGIAVSATVYLEQGTTHSLEIKASQDVLDKIEVKVENGKLVIKPKDNKTNFREEITIYIVSPEYEIVELAGSGKVLVEKKMAAEDLVLKIAGSGYMKFSELKAEEVEVKISGSGSMNLMGEGAQELSVSIAGSGDLNSEDFEVEGFNAKISGSGDCKVFVNGELDVSIAGSGSVYYKGSPRVESTVAGSGTVKKL